MLLIKKIRTTEMTEYAKRFFTEDTVLSHTNIGDLFKLGLVDTYFRQLGFDVTKKIHKLVGKRGLWALICGKAA